MNSKSGAASIASAGFTSCSLSASGPRVSYGWEGKTKFWTGSGPQICPIPSKPSTIWPGMPDSRLLKELSLFQIEFFRQLFDGCGLGFQELAGIGDAHDLRNEAGILHLNP